MKNKLKLSITQHAIKKMVLERMFNSEVDIEDYEGYWIIDELGDPEFIIETKD